MNQKLIVVLLLVTIVLSITSMAVIFTVNTDQPDSGNSANVINRPDPDSSGSVLLVVQSPVGGTG